VAGAIKATMGPENPTLEECAEQSSMTCSLYGSAVTVTGALLGLVLKGDQLVADLQPQLVENAIRDHAASAATLEKVRADFAAVLEGAKTPEDYKTALKAVDEALNSARNSVTATREATASARSTVDGLRQKLVGIAKTAQDARSEYSDGLLLDGSMTSQTQQLADELCDLADGDLPRGGRLSAAQAEQLRSYLTSVPCASADDGTKQPGTVKLPNGFKEPLDARLQAQAAAWDEVLTATDTSAQDQAIGQAFTALEEAADGTDARLDAVEAAVKTLDGAATSGVDGTKKGLLNLYGAFIDAVDSSAQVGTSLTKLKEQQDELGAKIKDSLREVSAETAAEVYKSVDQQVRQVAEIGDAGSKSVIAAFNRSIAGLKTTSDEVVQDAGATVDKQRGELLEREETLAASLAKGTEASLESIATSTSGSTRDVEGASALLSSSLNKVMLDLGDRSVNGSGLLGSMATSAAKADTADYQLALASQNAEGYANIRSRDVAGLLLRQAQFKASLTAADQLPPFHLEVPAGATCQTLYTLKIGGTA
jgi:hypothetical protein